MILVSKADIFHEDGGFPIKRRPPFFYVTGNSLLYKKALMCHSTFFFVETHGKTQKIYWKIIDSLTDM